MSEYEVTFRVVHRVRIPAASAGDAAQRVLDANPGDDFAVVSAVRVDLLNDVFKPAHEPPEPPSPPDRGKPTPGGGSPAGGVARVPVLPDCVARAA